MNKSDLRKKILKQRKNIDCKFVRVSGDVICEKFIQKYPDKDLCILAYSAIQNEVCTEKILSYYTNVYLPVTYADDIAFYKYSGSLIEGKFGIGEPQRTSLLTKKPDVIIVPGVCFDKTMNRVGYGKGYYDRFLKDYYDVPKIALAYEFQIVDKIEDVFESDIRLNGIITEKGEYCE